MSSAAAPGAVVKKPGPLAPEAEEPKKVMIETKPEPEQAKNEIIAAAAADSEPEKNTDAAADSTSPTNKSPKSSPTKLQRYLEIS